MQIDDARAIYALAKLEARKAVRDAIREQGKKISLTPVNLMVLQHRMLEENQEKFWALAKAKWGGNTE